MNNRIKFYLATGLTLIGLYVGNFLYHTCEAGKLKKDIEVAKSTSMEEMVTYLKTKNRDVIIQNGHITVPVPMMHFIESLEADNHARSLEKELRAHERKAFTVF